MAKLAYSRHRQPVAEGADTIGLPFTVDRTSAIAKSCEHRRVASERIVESNLRIDIVLVRDHYGGLAYIFESKVLAPQRVAVTTVNVDSHRHIAHGDVDQRQPCLMFADRCALLALERRINDGELPGRRSLFGHDAIATAVEMQIVDHIAGLIDAGEGRTQLEIHIAEVAVLGDPKADAGRGRVPGSDLHVDVAHRRVERAWIGVPDLGVERNDSGRRERHAGQLDSTNIASRVVATRGAGEDDHAADALLETGRVVSQNENRARAAGAKEAHGRPDQDRAAD